MNRLEQLRKNNLTLIKDMLGQVTKMNKKETNNKLTPEGKQMQYRIALEMVNNNLEPTPKNIESTFQNILKRKSNTIEEERNIVRNLLKPEIMAKVDKRVRNQH